MTMMTVMAQLHIQSSSCSTHSFAHVKCYIQETIASAPAHFSLSPTLAHRKDGVPVATDCLAARAAPLDAGHRRPAMGHLAGGGAGGRAAARHGLDGDLPAPLGGGRRAADGAHDARRRRRRDPVRVPAGLGRHGAVRGAARRDDRRHRLPLLQRRGRRAPRAELRKDAQGQGQAQGALHPARQHGHLRRECDRQCDS